MRPSEAFARRIGDHAKRYLDAAPRRGQVVSVFSDGIGIRLGEESDPALLAVQSAAVPLHPWAVTVEMRVRSAVGEVVRTTPSRIGFPDGRAVNLTGVEAAPLRIAPWAEPATVRARAHRPLFERVSKTPGQAAADFERTLDVWRRTGDPGALVPLLGRGGGSTPEGDDVLVGILAGLDAARPEDAKRVRRVLDREALPSKTALGSAQAVAAALDGAFPEPVVTLLATLGTEAPEAFTAALERVAELGASSGFAIVRGICAALAPDSVRGRRRASRISACPSVLPTSKLRA